MKSKWSVLVDGASRQSAPTRKGEDESIKTGSSGAHCAGQMRGFRLGSANKPSGGNAIAAAVAMLVGCIIIGVAETCFAETAQFAPINPDFIEYQRNIQAEPMSARTDEDEELLGYVPASISITAMAGAERAKKAAPRSFPATYDLRQSGRLTSVKDQRISGPCWSFAAMASLESCRLPGAAYDFSEKNMVNLHGWDWKHTNGGNGVIAMAYLCRWDGPVNESDDPYPAGTWQSSQAGLPVQKHIQQVRMILGKSSPTDNDDIKQALTDHGAVFASYYHANNSYSSGNNAYYYTGTNRGNHAVAIVGWDDNFDRTRFPVAAPSNGAYIVKNSWGTAWGDAGYFYVSYYDSTFAHEDMFVFHNAEPAGNYSRCYQYDPLGWLNSFKAPWAAAIYTASASEPLQAVGFYSATAASYELFIYTNVAAGAPRSGTLASSMSGTLPSAGFHTVPLATPVAVVAGQRFSIVLRLINGGDYPQAIEYRYSGLTSAATAAPGQTFYSTDGSQFTDLTALESTANFCIKGYTGTATTPPGMPVISSATHPDENGWYSNGNPSFTWTTPSDVFGLAGYSYVIDGSGTTIPDTTVDATGNSKSYSSIPDGTWYFHVRAKNNAGIWGAADHYRAQIDMTSPTFSSIAASPSLAKQGAAVTITFTASETLAANPAVTVNNHAASYSSKSGNSYTYSYAVLSSDPDGAATVAISGTDRAGNPGAGTSTSALAVDKTAPTCAIIRTDPSPTSASTVHFNVNFNETVAGFVQADVDLTGTAPGKSITGFGGGPQNFTVTVSGINGNGTAAIDVDAGKCSDAAGNLNTAGASVSYTIVQTSPGVIITPSGGSTAVTEGGSSDTYTVVLNTLPTANVTVTANAGSQLSASPTTLTFTPGQWNVAQAVTVSAVNDALYEGPHSGTITHAAASSDGNYNGISVGSVSVAINDNDAAPTVSFTSASQSKAEGGGTATVTAQLSAVSGLAATVPFTVSGTAANGTDYTITASPISILAGSTTGSASITITDDGLDEDDETVVVTMGVPANATAGATTVHTLTITDNDAAPTVSFTSASQSKAEGGGTATVTAQLSAVSGKAVSVPFTVSGSATGSGTDYAITASPINIPAGNATGSATITVVDDALTESNETVIVTMGTPANATKGTPSVHTLTITDNDAQGLVVSPTSVSVPEGGTASFSVCLAKQPQSSVTVTSAWISGDKDLSVSGGGTLTFNSGDWNQSKNVALAAAVDEDDENGSAIIAVTSSGLTTVNVAATEVDKDLAQFWGIYVDASRPDDSGDGYSWATAKKTIQAGVDLATDGTTVFVTNGIYNIGGRITPGYSLSNRVVIIKNITVRSVNGPDTTIIEGSGTNAYGTTFAMRCVYMIRGVLDGFTLRGGATMTNGATFYDRYGGGVIMDGPYSKALVQNSIIDQCLALGGGASTYSTLYNCTIQSNVATSSGGGAYGGALTKCNLLYNRASSGGGAFDAEMNNCALINNEASGGGAVHAGTLNNCLLLGNRATIVGGGSYFGTLRNCTFYGNISSNGGGAYKSTLNNCIVWGNKYSGGGTSDVSECTSFFTCAYELVADGGCINKAPLFVNELNGDFRILAASPCVDTGDNSLVAPGISNDLDGNLRIADGNDDTVPTVDMGAYEYGAQKTLTVMFNALGGTIPIPQIKEYLPGQIYGELPETVRSGYMFGGWCYEQGGTGQQVLPSTTVSMFVDHVLYAKWTPQVIGRILYVDASRPDDSGDGISWLTAKKSIQGAVNDAFAGETVMVTNGVYSFGGAVESGSYLANRVMVKKDIIVKSVNGPEVTIIRGSGTNAFGTTSAMRCVSMSKGVLDGFTLQGGATKYSGAASGDDKGGGVYAGNTTPRIMNCIICTNVASLGGGVYRGSLLKCFLLDNKSVGPYPSSGGGSYDSILRECHLLNNSAAVFGGGAYGGYLYNCDISGNIAQHGGGSAFATLNRCRIASNVAMESGGGSRDGELKDCVLVNNTAPIGGGVYSGSLQDCIVSSNTANHGGGCNYGTLTRCVIAYNMATNSGGGARMSILNNCLITDNIAQNGGGHYDYAYDPSFPRSLNNCTIVNNMAKISGGGCEGGMLNNCIVWSNQLTSGTPNNVTNTIYFYTCSPNIAISNGCINSYPLFANPSSGDYRLKTGSPCIDTGDNTHVSDSFDKDGHVRIVDGDGNGTETVDMGTYEYGAMSAMFTVSFNAAGGTDAVPPTKVVSCGTSYGPLASSSRTGFTFAGWWTGSDGAGMEITHDTVATVTSRQILYAKWTPTIYTVNFDPQDGTMPSPGSKTVAFTYPYGPLALTTRSGYTFAGWWTGAGGTGAEVTSSTIMTTISNHMLYAKWDELTTTTTPVSVPLSWLDGQPILLGAAGGDYDIAAWTDLDRDGRFSWEEYIADTDPMDEASTFPPLETVLLPNSAVGLRIDPSSTGRLYEILWCPDLTVQPQSWLPYGVSRSGTGTGVVFNITNQVPTGIFRSRVRLP